MTNISKNAELQQSCITAVISRFLFVLLCWIPLLNIVISFWIIILPYWLFTGKFYFNSYHFKKINDWHSRLIR
jgi:hypothetical protein